MRLRRRSFIAGAAAAALAPAQRGQAATFGTLRAGVHRVQLAPDPLPMTDVWAYEGRIPGPEIRVPQGKRVTQTLVNALPQPTTVHWHGIRIDNVMDGVPDLTQPAVAPGQSWDYDFAVPDAGTYWYHTHNRTVEQMARGLSGPLIVTEAQPPDVDRDMTLHLSDWRMVDPAQIRTDFDNRMDQSHAGRLGNYLTINGQQELITEVKHNDRLRLRLINAATDKVITLAVQGLEGWVVALDGMPLAAPKPLEPSDLTLAPAQRVDLIVDVTATQGQDAYLIEKLGESGYLLGQFPVRAGATPRRDAPEPLPPNPAQATLADLDAPSAPLIMDGGAMRGLRRAFYKGDLLDGRALAQQGQFWALNGTAGLPEAPLAEVSLGDTLRLPLQNNTAFPHAIHLHGHHFREVLADGSLGPWRDTILVQPATAREVIFVADNPGDWLLHCHMVSHHASGMGTWLRVNA